MMEACTSHEPGTSAGGKKSSKVVIMDAANSASSMITKSIRRVDNIYDDYRASGRQGQEGAMQVTDQENTVNASITEGIYLITVLVLVFGDMDDITETKIYVIAILTSLAVANLAPIAVVALTWKIWKRRHKQIVSAQAAQQAASILMDTIKVDTEPTYMVPSVAQHRKEGIQMTENPAYAAVTDYYNVVNVP